VIRWLNEGPGTLGQSQLPSVDWTGIPKPPYWDATTIPWPPVGSLPLTPPPGWELTGQPWPPSPPPGWPATIPFPLPPAPQPNAAPTLPPLPPVPQQPPLPTPPNPIPPSPSAAPKEDDSATRVGRALIGVAIVTLFAVIVLS
jgi:hypothetical protein